MPARVITNSQGTVSVNQQAGAQKAQIKASAVSEKKEQVSAKIDPTSRVFQEMQTHDVRAKFYTGHERLDLQNIKVQRVRELQEEKLDLYLSLSRPFGNRDTDSARTLPHADDWPRPGITVPQ